MNPPRRDPVKAVVMLLLTTAGWGISFPLTKALLMIQTRLAPGASEWFITAQGLVLRFALAAGLVALICRGRWRNKIGRAHV